MQWGLPRYLFQSIIIRIQAVLSKSYSVINSVNNSAFSWHMQLIRHTNFKSYLLQREKHSYKMKLNYSESECNVRPKAKVQSHATLTSGKIRGVFSGFSANSPLLSASIENFLQPNSPPHQRDQALFLLIPRGGFQFPNQPTESFKQANLIFPWEAGITPTLLFFFLNYF